jgi:hypothetical protein
MTLNPAKQTIIENQLRLKGFKREGQTRYRNESVLLVVLGVGWLCGDEADDKILGQGSDEDSLIQFLHSRRHQGPGDYVEMEGQE